MHTINAVYFNSMPGIGTEDPMFFESKLLECPETLSGLELPGFLRTQLIHLNMFEDNTLLNERY